MDRKTLIKRNAIHGLESAIELSNSMVHLRKEHAKAILALLKEQEPKTGHWNGPECSHCHAILEKRANYEWCPHCGAHMIKE